MMDALPKANIQPQPGIFGPCKSMHELCTIAFRGLCVDLYNKRRSPVLLGRLAIVLFR
jgi:hypothetical protein